MQFTLKKIENEQPSNLLKQLGYHFLKKDDFENQLIFSRRIYGQSFPRLHIYLRENKDKVIISLHLDQKKPSYKGAVAHNADYGGNVLKAEAQRIKDLWQK